MFIPTLHNDILSNYFHKSLFTMGKIQFVAENCKKNCTNSFSLYIYMKEKSKVDVS